MLVLDEERQKAMAVSGHLLPTGKHMIVYSFTAAGPAFIYNSSGQPVYQVVEGISAIDWLDNLYYIQGSGNGYAIIKWNPEGQRIASFNLPLGVIRIEGNGTIYCLVFDREAEGFYRVVRWQRK